MLARRPIFRLCLFVISAAVYLTGLSSVGIYSTDEPRYAAIGAEMAHSGDWITPRLWGHPWFEKSPLLYWMTGLASLLRLGPETAPRLPVALGALALVVFLYRCLKPRLGCPIALHSAIMLAGSVGWIGFGNVGVTDVPLTVNFTICLLLVVFGGPAWLAGTFLGLAALAKGLVPFVLFIPALWWLHRSKRLHELLPISLGCLLVAGPWYTVITLRFGRAFFDEFIIKQHFARAFSDSIQHVQPVWFYIRSLTLLLLPWAGLLPFIGRRKVLADDQLRFLAIWTLFAFVFLSLIRNKLPGYILPLVPILCILMAAAIEDLQDRARLVQALTAGILVAVGLQVLPGLPRILHDGWSRASLATRPETTSVVCGAAAALGVWWIGRKGRQTLALCAVGGIAFAGFLVIKLGPLGAEIDRLATARPLSMTASKDGCVLPVDRALRYGLSYYWNFEVPECNDETLPKRIRKP